MEQPTRDAKGRLRESLGEAQIHYVHVAFAGNPKELRRAAGSHADCLRRYHEYVRSNPDLLERFDFLLQGLLSEGLRVCLMCYERHPDDCHRSVLLRLWSEFTGVGAEILHLAADGAPRLVGDQRE